MTYLGREAITVIIIAFVIAAAISTSLWKRITDIGGVVSYIVSTESQMEHARYEAAFIATDEKSHIENGRKATVNAQKSVDPIFAYFTRAYQNEKKRTSHKFWILSEGTVSLAKQTESAFGDLGKSAQSGTKEDQLQSFRTIDSLVNESTKLTQTGVEGARAAIPQFVKKKIALLVLIILILVVLVAVFGGRWIIRTVTQPIHDTVNLLKQIALGDFEQKMTVERDDEIAEMVQALNTATDGLKMKAAVTQAIAAGDWSMDVPVVSSKDGLGLSLKTMVESVRGALEKVQYSVAQVRSGANQVSDVSQSLSVGATESAATLEEITSELTEIGSQAHRNAQSAQEAAEYANNGSDSAEKGALRVSDMSRAIAEIRTSSSDISNVIKIIEDIAFQTNLLALNAAVEAACAGQHGKWFAVVADEVRTLANRSAKAAQETTQLLEKSNEKVLHGESVARDVVVLLDEIRAGISSAAERIDAIATASQMQAQGVSQITMGVQELDHVTQQNAAHAEESAASSEELSSQSMELQYLVQQFCLRSENDSPKRSKSGQKQLSY